MFKLVFKQANWTILGSIFGFSIGFFVKIYLLDIVGLEAWGKYVTAQTLASAADTLLAIGIPYTIIKYIPSLLPKDIKRAESIASGALKYSLLSGLIFVFAMYFLSSLFDEFIYSEINDISWILFIMCIHVPISLLFGVITSLYRSILKIKELVVYGTLISVTFRAISTFIVFQFTNDIIYFIFIELITQFSVLLVLLFLFHKKHFSLFNKSEILELNKDKVINSYRNKIFLNTCIAFIAGKSLNIIISILLPAEDIGAYNILLTITALTTFLLVNLNKVFAPAISKLYEDRKITELNDLYRQTTFSINITTIPLVILIIIFSDEILNLYSSDLITYKYFLFFLLIGGSISSAAGSSGTFMLMAGLEKENLILQSIKAFLIITLSLWLTPLYGLASIVLIYVISMLFFNLLQLFYIKKYLGISPFSNSLLLLLLFSIPVIYFCINQDYIFRTYHYFFIPFCVYVIYFSLFFAPINRVLKHIKE